MSDELFCQDINVLHAYAFDCYINSKRHSHAAVSYTHLDVYKRQLLVCLKIVVHFYALINFDYGFIRVYHFLMGFILTSGY